MKPERLVWFACIAFCLRIGLAQDFQHSYTIAPNGQFFIDTVSGNIKIQRYKGDKIEILAYRKGSDSSLIEIEDRSSGDRIDVRAHARLSQQSKLPQGSLPQGKPPQGKIPPGGFDPGRFPQAKFPPGGGFDMGRFDMGDNRVDFEINVPKAGDFSGWIHTFKGNLEISNFSGQLRATSARGNVDVKDVRGFIRGEAINGTVQVELGSRKEENDMKFSSRSGDVVVKAPGNLDAEVFMSSDVGRVKIDYPIPIQDMRYGPKRFAQGKLGSGKQRLTIESTWGSVSLLKK
jgi:hypothetical protein